MNISDMVARVKRHPDFAGAGMVLCHNGVVRATNAAGDKAVTSLTITADREKLAEIVARHKRLPGIIEILAEIAPDGRKLSVGDDIMLLVVAGDVRKNVIPVMTSLIDEIKANVTRKREVGDGD